MRRLPRADSGPPCTHPPFFAQSCSPSARPAPSPSRPSTTDPREFTEDARKAYAQSLRDARSLIADKKYSEAIVVLDRLTARAPARAAGAFPARASRSPTRARSTTRSTCSRACSASIPSCRNRATTSRCCTPRRATTRWRATELEAAIAAAPDYVDCVREPRRHLCATRCTELREGDRPRRPQQVGAGQAQARPRRAGAACRGATAGPAVGAPAPATAP